MPRHPDTILKFFNENNIPVVLLGIEFSLILNEHKNDENNIHVKLFNELLDKNFQGLLAKTFNEKIVFWYDEVITEEILILIHNYFRNQCCNINNIIFMVATTGLKTYYENYCNLNRTLGMKIFELLMANVCYDYLTDLKEKNIDKNIKKLFSYYGGSYDIDPPERTLLSLFATQYKDYATIEMMGKCSSLEKIEDWLEYKTFFLDAEFVEKYKKLHKKYIDNDLNLTDELISIDVNSTVVFNERFGFGNYQEIVDSQCMFSLVRETLNFESHVFISEKTFRCFYNHVIPLPVTGSKTIEDLKNYGFWIAEDLVDYSYLQEDIFAKRLKKLEQVLNNLAKIPMQDYQSYYEKNKEKFRHNQRLVVDWTNIIDQRLKTKFEKTS